MNIGNVIKSFKAFKENNEKDLSIVILIRDRKFKSEDKNSSKMSCINYAFSNSMADILDILQENGFFVDVVWENDSDIQYFDGFNADKTKYTLSLNLQDCKNTLGYVHLKNVYGISNRNMVIKDVDEIVELESKYFTEDKVSTRKKYTELLEFNDYICKVYVDSQNNFIGYIRYKYCDKHYLSKKYPNVSGTIQELNGIILYISTCVIKEKYSHKGIASIIINTLIQEAYDKGVKHCLAFSVKDGVYNVVNSKKLFEGLSFNLLNVVEDAWNQSKSAINYCPICNKNSLSICNCSALVYYKQI